MPNFHAAPPNLALIRGKKGISLDQIAGDTKIAIRHLKAIEACEFGALPGGMYGVSFVRQYARAIDFDETELVDLYYTATGSGPEPSPPNPETHARRSRLARVWGPTADV